MTHRETPSKTNTSVLFIIQAQKEFIFNSDKKFTNSDLKLKYYNTVPAHNSSVSRQTTVHLLKHFAVNTKIKARQCFDIAHIIMKTEIVIK